MQINRLHFSQLLSHPERCEICPSQLTAQNKGVSFRGSWASTLRSPGVMSGRALTAGTPRLMLMARTSVAAAAVSVFFPPSKEPSLGADLPPAETWVAWLELLISEAGWMGTGLCFRLRACRVWLWEEDVVATCWPRMVRFWTWFLSRRGKKNKTAFALTSSCTTRKVLSCLFVCVMMSLL